MEVVTGGLESRRYVSCYVKIGCISQFFYFCLKVHSTSVFQTFSCPWQNLGISWSSVTIS